MHVGVYLLLHVVVLVFDVCRHGAFAVFLVHLGNAVFDEVFTVFEAVAVVVAYDVRQRCALDV